MCYHNFVCTSTFSGIVSKQPVYFSSVSFCPTKDLVEIPQWHFWSHWVGSVWYWATITVTARLRKFHPSRHSTVSAETTTVGDERCSPAGILFVAVWAHHPAASPIALAESSGAHRLQACSPCVQVPSRSSTAVPCRRTQPAGQSESPFHHVIIAVRSAYADVNYRRQGLSSRCSPCLELSAAARRVCTVSFHLPKPYEDSPLQQLLCSCQAREVISLLRLFLLLLLLDRCQPCIVTTVRVVCVHESVTLGHIYFRGMGSWSVVI